MALSVPTTSAVSSFQLVPSIHPAVAKSLNRLSRPSLLSLTLDWLDEKSQDITPPYLGGEDEDVDSQDFYPPASSLEALHAIYTDFQARKGSKRDVVDRIIEGDWRNGLSLYQLAMADMQYLYDHPSSQKWTALKIVRLAAEGEAEPPPSKTIPRFHPATFLQNLRKEVFPDVKAHYSLDRHRTLPMILLRVFIIESPYNTSLALTSSKQTTFDSSKTFYVAFPDDSPFVYVSLTTTSTTSGQAASRTGNKSIRNLILTSIPKAFSRPRERYKFESTSFSARNLQALIEWRGGGRTNAAGGGWSIYAENKKDGSDNPLNIQLPIPEPTSSDVEEEKSETPKGLKRTIQEDSRVIKRRKLVAKGRFGNSAKAGDGKGIERLDVVVVDPFQPNAPPEDYSLADELGDAPVKPKGRKNAIVLELEKYDEDEEDGEFRPHVMVTLSGQHVFAGIRELVEDGVIDGERMPGWMTGENGVTVGRVRDGRISDDHGRRL